MTSVPVYARPTRRWRGIAAVGILLAWGAGLVLLVQREFFRGRTAVLAEAALRLAPGATYYVVEQNGRQIGFASTTIDTSTTAIEVVDYFIADLPVAGRSFRASARSIITLSRALALRTFDVQVESPEAPLRVIGEAEGDSAVRFVMQAPRQPPDTQRIAVQGPILLPTLIPIAAMLTAEPKVGRTVSLSSFDPTTMATRPLVLRFDAESLFTVVDSAAYDSTKAEFVPALTDTVRAWKLVPAEGGGFSGWVDAQGRVLLTTQPGGISIKRMAYEIAFENWRRRRLRGETMAPTTQSDIMEGTAVAAGALPDAAGLTELRLRLSGVSLEGFDLTGGRQLLTGDELTIRREPREALEADWNLANRPTAFRDQFAADLKSEPLLQSNNSAIVRLAVRIAGNDRDPRVVAEKLNRWVHDSLRKEITFSVPNAVQVLRTRAGDCNEHTQLYVALARAAGIPARIVTGLAYVDGKFYYHAWPEVRLRDWVAVDPTFGQFPADAAHLRFVRGGLGRQAEQLRLVGNLRLEVHSSR